MAKTKNKKAYYKTVIKFVVLSEEPIPDDIDLSDIVNETVNGDYSGDHEFESINEAVDGKTMAKLLKEQGSDPEFFQLDEDGNDLNEDEGNEEESEDSDWR